MDTCPVQKETLFSVLLLSSLENNVLMVLPACFHTHGFSRISHNSKLAHKGVRMTIGRTWTKIEETGKLSDRKEKKGWHH